jgi:hypothetical protein
MVIYALAGIAKFLIVLVVLAAVGTGAVLASPTLAIQNNCGKSITIPVDLPLVGHQINPGSSEFRVPPGDYQVTRTGNSVRATGPFGLDSGVFTIGENFNLSQDGNPVNLGASSTKISLGTGSRVVVAICP